MRSIADLYRLTEHKVASLERFAELSAHNLVTAIQNSKTPALNKFITALGIRHVGVQTATTLARGFGSIEKLELASEEELLKLPDIGKVVAESILAYFADEDNLKMLAELKELGVRPEMVASGNLPLTGKNYVITGTLSGMGREEAEDKLRALGATITSGVTKKTTALIVGENREKVKSRRLIS